MKPIRLLSVVGLLLSLGHSAPAQIENTGPLSLEQVTQRAVQVLPASRQMLWQQGEFICFIHFGVNTFTGREWGTGKEDPRIFNPRKLDTDQWCRAMKAAGMTKAILTVKHHDGFCLWQTRYTQHSVAASPWRNGQGDVLRDMVNSCREAGLQVGVYLSPADLYQIENPKGLYGNLSPYTERTIPRPVRGRPFKDQRVFTYRCDDYNEYFMNQLFELLTEYGPVHEVWFDGAHPKRKGGQTYTYQSWYQLIRTLAPDAVIFGKGPDVRWCGNEAGHTRAAEWNVIPLATTPDQCTWPDMRDSNLGGIDKLKQALNSDGTLHWYPAETNTSIRHGWFWRDEQQHVRGADEMLDIWYNSVGGNTVFLLNVPPNADGLFPERDCRVLEVVGATIGKTFAMDLARNATVRASAEKGPEFAASLVLDGNPSTCWMPPEGTTQAHILLHLTEEKTFNRILFQEQIREYSQRIKAFAIDAWMDGRWAEIAAGQTVGYKRICRTQTVTTDRLRLRILDSRVCPTISNVGLYFESIRLSVPVFRRNKDGNVSIHCQPAGPQIRYTLDGSAPGQNSPPYTAPIPFPEGGVVKARAYDPTLDRYGETGEAIFGPAKRDWRVVRVDSEQHPGEQADYAIDGDPQTFWHTQWSGASPGFPHEIVIDLGKTQYLTGFTYLPRQDRADGGVIKEYALYISQAPDIWEDPVAQGQFDNILNNPTEQRVMFGRRVSGRFLRLKALRSVNDKPWAGAAEIGIITGK